MNKDVDKRLSAEQAIKHPWLKNNYLKKLTEKSL